MCSSVVLSDILNATVVPIGTDLVAGKKRRIVEETVPAFVAHEQAMASALTPAEQRTLNGLLTKIILGKANWPTIVQKETAS